MKVAIPTWENRVSPVFDVAKHLLVVDVEDNTEIARSEAVTPGTALSGRANRLAELGVNVLICGAISQPLERMLVSATIKVIPHTCGAVEDVLQAFLSGQLTEQAFLMPGCCGQRRRFRNDGHGGGRGRGRSGGEFRT